MNFVNKRLSRPLPTYPAISERRGIGSMAKDVFISLTALTIIIATLSKAFLIHVAMILLLVICIPFLIVFTLMEEVWGAFSYASSKIKKIKPE